MPFPSCLHLFCEVEYNSGLSLIGKVLPLFSTIPTPATPDAFSFFFFTFSWNSKVCIWYTWCRFSLTIDLLGFCRASWIWGLMSKINLGTSSVLVLYILLLLFFLYLLFWYSNYVSFFVGIFILEYFEGFCVFFCHCCFCFFFFFLDLFLFWLSVLEVSITVSSNWDILSSAILRLLMKPLQTFFISITMLLCLAFLFSSFLEFPSSYLNYPSVLECCLLFSLNLLGY